MTIPENISQGIKQNTRYSSQLFWKGLTLISVIISLFSLVVAFSYKSEVMRHSALIEILQGKLLETEQNLTKIQQDTDKNVKLVSKALSDEIQSAKSQIDQQIKLTEARVNQINALIQLQGVYSFIEHAHMAILRDGDYAKAAGEIEKARNRLSKISETLAGDQKLSIQKLQQSLQDIAVQLQNPTPSVAKLLSDILDKLGNVNNTPPVKPETQSVPGPEEKPTGTPTKKPEQS
ncbi:MAG TPA: hypothetical protein VNM22_17195 [Candidatus Limnocylindrales bacterium]|nr:hypothetical protein [Candidatus Limnocylindrales bacterium]